jgi:hypothetical protein
VADLSTGGSEYIKMYINGRNEEAATMVTIDTAFVDVLKDF